MTSPASRGATLRRGSVGPEVAALRDQLDRAGLAVQGDARDYFGAATEETVRTFQRRRHLQVDGICGPDTWSALREEPLALGDRLLALRSPMARGDDVHQLQQQLSALGFDPGRPDGIFGPRTDAALREFQRNAAIAVDGICGRDTLATLRRLGGLADGEITQLRERESFAATPRALPGRRILIASRAGSAKPAVEGIAKELEGRGARCTTATELEVDTDAARSANELDVDLCVLVQPVADPAWRCAFYASGRYRSFRGSAIAQRVAEELITSGCVPTAARAAGLSSGVLRETRMPAVVVQLELDTALDLEPRCAAVVEGIRRGFEDPPELTAV